MQLFARTPEVVTCSQAPLTRPEVGIAYRGEVSIDDYKFSANVPRGLTGWGGVAASAPFHGFTIFLDHSLRSCILFEVHVRVDDADGPLHSSSAKSLSLGQAKAWQSSASVTTKEGGLMNIRTSFTFEHDGQIDDGEVMLISPSTEQRSGVQVYEDFLKSVHFGGN
jgi:hypothetical protein